MWAAICKNRDLGLLVFRIFLGGFFFWAHGLPKITGGPELWKELGDAMRHLGVGIWPKFWGFMAAMAESAGSLLVIVGFAFRPACMVIAMVMSVAAIEAYASPPSGVPPLLAASHAIEVGIVFLSLILVGPGKYSVDRQ
jgi:putative oxidoreductase